MVKIRTSKGEETAYTHGVRWTRKSVDIKLETVEKVHIPAADSRESLL